MARISRRRFLEESAAAGAAAATLAHLAPAGAAQGAAGKTPPLRLCRYVTASKGKKSLVEPKAALYADDHVIDLGKLAAKLKVKDGAESFENADLLNYLPPHSKNAAAVAELAERYRTLSAEDQASLRTPVTAVHLLAPIPEPKKVILLAGNYGSHIVEGGGQAPERAETFPYFFWKPPTTTLTNPGDPIRIPKVSPDHIDWEIELGVIIGKTCRDVSEKDALQYVAGYSVCNDVSDRKFTINPERKKRDKDGFFDWLHGKWHDTFLPMGPCVRSAVAADPQAFAMKLRVNGMVMQDASTGQMIFPVAALVSILSTFTTLEPGDIISTGTPAGVGAGRKPPVFLKKGDLVEAEIEGIGVLRNPVA